MRIRVARDLCLIGHSRRIQTGLRTFTSTWIQHIQAKILHYFLTIDVLLLDVLPSYELMY